MAESTETTTETTEAPHEEASKESGGGDQGKTFSQSELDRIVEQRLTRERAKYSDYDDVKSKATKFDELQTANQTEMEKLQSQLAEERSARESAEKTTASMKRTQYGVDKGLPLALAKKLTGSSDDELDAEIEELQPFIGSSEKTTEKSPEEKKAMRLEELRSGASDLGSSSADPKERAAEAVRNFQRQRD